MRAQTTDRRPHFGIDWNAARKQPISESVKAFRHAANVVTPADAWFNMGTYFMTRQYRSGVTPVRAGRGGEAVLVSLLF